MEGKECGGCIWNIDGLCDMRGLLVDDDDLACKRYEEEENSDDEI